MPNTTVGSEWEKDPVAVERANRVAAKKKAGPQRRRMVDPTTCDRDYSPAEVEFMNAMQAYKVRSGRQFPTWSEVLEVLRGLGYTPPVEAEASRRLPRAA